MVTMCVCVWARFCFKTHLQRASERSLMSLCVWSGRGDLWLCHISIIKHIILINLMGWCREWNCLAMLVLHCLCIWFIRSFLLRLCSFFCLFQMFYRWPFVNWQRNKYKSVKMILVVFFCRRNFTRLCVFARSVWAPNHANKSILSCK